MLLHLPDGHRPEQVQTEMIAGLWLPAHLRRSLPWDQGKEMARHAQISLALDMPIYFCDPYSTWQRGSGTGSTYLATHGWQVTAVDMVPKALAAARRRTAAAGVSARFVHGDVTRLPELDIGD